MNHVMVADLGYGDAGKGTVVDWLCSPQGGGPVHTVVRFNGGAQAGHNVVTADGRHHTFAQFGSGTFTPGVRTHLSRFVLVDPLALAAEASHLARIGVHDALGRLTVDRDALLVTPYHQAANRARELARGKNRHGSCGMGIGETASYALSHAADAPRVSDCAATRTLARKLTILRDWLTSELGALYLPDAADLCDDYRAFAAAVPLVDSGYLRRLLRAGRAVFEGAQGILLDEWHGFHPYTTWSTTTFDNAETLLAEAGESAIRLGVTRCYMTRHGPGPFVTEDPTLELPEPHNRQGTERGLWQGPFRTGHLDAVALRYAVEVSGGVDAVALTHLDTAARQPLRMCRSYQVDGQRLDQIPRGQEHDLGRQEQLTQLLLRARPDYEDPGGDWPVTVAELLDVPVALTSYGPATTAKRVTNCRGGVAVLSGRSQPQGLQPLLKETPMRASLPARLASAAAVAALAVSGVLLTAGAASAGGKPPAKSEATFLHLNNKVVAHARHHTDTISGKLTADRKGVTGETVTLFTWSRKHKSFVSTGLTATSGTGGAFSFTITAPKRTSHYEAKFAGDKAVSPQLRRSHSNTITITVRHHAK